MVDITERIKDFVALPSVKTVWIALAVNMLLQYAYNDVLLGFVSIGVAFLAVGLSAYVVGLILKKVNYVNIFIMGFVAYFGYVYSLLFFKLTTTVPVIAEDFQSALVFGLLTVGVYWAMENFGS